MPAHLWQQPPGVHTFALYGVGLLTIANLSSTSGAGFYLGMPIDPSKQFGSVSGDTGIPEVSANSLSGWFGMESPAGCGRSMELHYVIAKPGEDPMTSPANHINVLIAEEPLGLLFGFLRNVSSNCSSGSSEGPAAG
jgi:hypothetical protein